MTRVMAVDAGRSLGLCVVDFPRGREPEVVAVSQWVEKSVPRSIGFVFEFFSTTKPEVVVAEQFDLRPGNKFLADLSPVYLNGALEFALYTWTDIVWQTPAQAKSLVSNDNLKRLGEDFYPTGKTVTEPDADDARDALRHALYYAVKELGHMPTIEKGWRPQTQERETCCGDHPRTCLTCPDYP